MKNKLLLYLGGLILAFSILLMSFSQSQYDNASEVYIKYLSQVYNYPILIVVIIGIIIPLIEEYSFRGWIIDKKMTIVLL